MVGCEEHRHQAAILVSAGWCSLSCIHNCHGLTSIEVQRSDHLARKCQSLTRIQSRPVLPGFLVLAPSYGLRGGIRAGNSPRTEEGRGGLRQWHKREAAEEYCPAPGTHGAGQSCAWRSEVVTLNTSSRRHKWQAVIAMDVIINDKPF